MFFCNNNSVYFILFLCFLVRDVNMNVIIVSPKFLAMNGVTVAMKFLFKIIYFSEFQQCYDECGYSL